MHLVNPFWSAAGNLTLVLELLFEDASSTGPYANTAGRGPTSATRFAPDGTVTTSTAQVYEGAQSLRLAGASDGHEGIVTDSSSYLEIGTADFKAEIACYFNAILPSTFGNVLIDWYGGAVAGPGPGLYLDKTTGHVSLGNNNGVSSIVIDGGVAPSLNVWHVIGMRRAGGVTTIYMDGVDLGSASDTTSYTMGAHGVSVGRSQSTAGNVIDAYVDRVRLYNGNV